MLRKPLHILSVLSLLVCVAGAVLWHRAGDAGDGDYIGHRGQSGKGRDWAQDEWSARSAGSTVQFIHFRRTSGDTPGKAQIHFAEDGYFWKDGVEKNVPDVRRTSPTTAPSAATAETPAPSTAKPIRLISETTAATTTRGVVMPHWVLVAATALLPLRWMLVMIRRARDGEGAHGNADRVPLLARLFGAAASLSILLAFALGVAWVKSWYVGDRVSWRDESRPQMIDVHSGRGELVFHYHRVDEKLLRTAPELAGAANGFHWRQDPDATVGYTPKTFCFEHEARAGEEGSSRTFTAAAPYWFLMIGALVMPSWWLRNQKFGPIKVSSFGRPVTPNKAKGIVSHHVTQRPI